MLLVVAWMRVLLVAEYSAGSLACVIFTAYNIEIFCRRKISCSFFLTTNKNDQIGKSNYSPHSSPSHQLVKSTCGLFSFENGSSRSYSCATDSSVSFSAPLTVRAASTSRLPSCPLITSRLEQSTIYPSQWPCPFTVPCYFCQYGLLDSYEWQRRSETRRYHCRMRCSCRNPAHRRHCIVERIPTTTSIIIHSSKQAPQANGSYGQAERKVRRQ